MKDPIMEPKDLPTYDRLRKTSEDDVTYRGNHDIKVVDDDDVGETYTGHKYHGYGTLITVAFAFLFVFIGYVGTEALQTHINSEAGLGTTAVSIVYGAFFLSCFGFGPAIVGHFGPKWPVVVAWLCYLLFVLANFYPRTWTLYPAAALIGLAGGPVWISMGVYTTSLALEHAALNKKPREQVLSFFNGIFIGIFFFQFPTSALISSIVFFVEDLKGGGNAGRANHTLAESPIGTLNGTLENIYANITTTSAGGHRVSVCGASYCSYLSSHLGEIHKPDPEFIYINLGIFSGCVVLGMVLLSFQRSVRPPDHKYMSVKNRLNRLVQVLRDWRWLLLAPTFALCGVMQGMAINTFSQAFVNCTLDIRWVAYVLTLRGLTCMTTSFVSGKLAEWLPQWSLLLTAYLIELGVLLVWLLWTPTADKAWVFFLVQGVEGVGAGSLRVHATALLGLLFPSDQEVAFAHLNMMVALATCFIMAMANFLCFGPQAYIALAILGTSMVCYGVLKLCLVKEKRQLMQLNQGEPTKATEEEKEKLECSKEKTDCN